LFVSLRGPALGLLVLLAAAGTPRPLLASSPLAGVTSPLASNIVVESAFLEEPLPGAVFAAGDTVRARAVVTGSGTGVFRAIFFLDGDAVAMEEGFLESGRPVVVEPHGPIVSRRLGEHRFQFVVESPQNVAARPITFLCVPPPHGIAVRPAAKHEAAGSDSTESDSAQTDSTGADSSSASSLPPLTSPPAEPPSPRFAVGGTYLLVGKSDFRDEPGAGIAWSAWDARYEFSKTASLTADAVWRLRVDEPENGSGIPEQLEVRYQGKDGHITWGDLAPSFAADAPLLLSSVPRRSGEAVSNGPIGTLQGFLALDSRPRSADGRFDYRRSYLGAARWSRVFGDDRWMGSLYTGVARDHDAGYSDSIPNSATFGGTARLRFADDWSVLGDFATVHRWTYAYSNWPTAARGVLDGKVAGFEANAEAFRYESDLVTSLNPYALSDRLGGAAKLTTMKIANWRFFGTYRHEEPVAKVDTLAVRVDRYSVGGQLALNDLSWVTPELIRIETTVDGQEVRESRAAGELVIDDPKRAETRARFDVTLFEGEVGPNSRRVVTSASLVSTRKYPGRVTTTLSGGIEHDDQRTLQYSDRTIQGTAEFRWEAIAGKFLVMPFLTYLDRNYESTGRDERHLTGRLQLAWVRVPGLGNNALSIEGRVDRRKFENPIEDHSTEGSVEVTFGQRFHLTPSP
jgi:hypothetical protein